MSKGAAVGVVGVGVLYLIAVPIAEAMLLATGVVILAIMFALAATVVALFYWVILMKDAILNCNWGKVRDLVLVPIAGVLSAVLLAKPFAVWAGSFQSSDTIKHLNDQISQHLLLALLAIPVGIGAFCLFLGLFVLTFYAFASDEPSARLFAYLGAVFYSMYLTGVIGYENIANGSEVKPINETPAVGAVSPISQKVILSCSVGLINPVDCSGQHLNMATPVSIHLHGVSMAQRSALCDAGYTEIWGSNQGPLRSPVDYEPVMKQPVSSCDYFRNHKRDPEDKYSVYLPPNKPGSWTITWYLNDQSGHFVTSASYTCFIES